MLVTTVGNKIPGGSMKIVQATKAATSDTAPRGAVPAPYFDLDASIKVADAIINRGGGTCSSDQLAAWLDYKTVRSGTYLTRVSAANKHFGLIDQTGDRFTVTERGQTILAPVMPEDAVSAKADAFLSVALFGKVYEDLRGKQLPPEVGLRNLFARYGVTKDRIPQAVRVFLSSADQAGFFSATGDRSRLIRPGATTSKPVAPEGKKEETSTALEKPRSGGGGDGPSGVHSAITALLRDLPAPGPWDAQRKKDFMTAFTGTIEWLYPSRKEDTPS